MPGSPVEAQFPYLATQGIQQTPESSPASPEPEPPRLRNRRPTPPTGRWLPVVIGGAAGLFVLAVLAAYLLWGGSGSPMASATPSQSVVDATADGAVRGYLQALAAGDADAALGFALTLPDDPTMLTDEVLAGLRKTAPISGIEVSPAGTEGAFQRVTAAYLLGRRTVHAEFQVFRQDQVWRLESVAAEVDLSALPLGEVPLTLNGVPLATSSPALFPGHYTLDTTADRYTVVEPDFVVESPGAPPGIPAAVDLSSQGRDEVIAAIEAKLAACVKQRKLAPKGCGFAISNPEGTRLKPSTMRWSVRSGGEFDDLEVSLDRPGSATAAVDIDIRGKVRGTDGSQWQVSVLVDVVRADLTGEKVSVHFG